MHFPQTSYTTMTSQQPSAGQLTATQYIGLSHPQSQQVITNNGISYIPGQNIAGAQQQHQYIANSSATIANAITPQVLQQLQQHLCSQNVITQPTTQYIISTQGSNSGTAVTAIPQGYQTVQTVGGQQVLIPTNPVNQQMTNGSTVPTTPSSNQLVQLVLSNGQVMTTTLGNLQAMGVTAPTQLSATTPQQYSTQYQSNGNLLVSGGQSTSIPVQTQLVTNSMGQVFAITPQIPNQTQITQPIIAQNQSNTTTTQYIQFGGQPIVQQIIGQPVPQQMVNNAALVQQQQQQQLEENAKLMVQQQFIQQQQQIVLQQKQSQSQTQSNIKSNELTQTQTSNSPNLSNTQTIVSSTTSKPQSLNSSINQENTSHSFESPEIKTDRISVQSQTSSPSSSNSTMEAESTTQCNLPNKGLKFQFP